MLMNKIKEVNHTADMSRELYCTVIIFFEDNDSAITHCQGLLNNLSLQVCQYLLMWDSVWTTPKKVCQNKDLHVLELEFNCPLTVRYILKWGLAQYPAKGSYSCLRVVILLQLSQYGHQIELSNTILGLCPT